MALPQGWAVAPLEAMLDYEQPQKYIVESTAYCESYLTPVLTAGKSFIIGHTDETDGIYSEILPVIIFDDFTTSSQFVTFPFKVKSSAMKMLQPTMPELDIKYLFYRMQLIRHNATTHKRYWISDYSKNVIEVAPLAEQHRIVAKIDALFSELDKGVEMLQTVRAQLRTYRQAVLKWAFDNIDGIKSIVDCFDITGGLTKNPTRNSLPNKKPYLRVANVYYNRLDLSEIKTIGVEDAEIDRTLLKKGDLLFVEGNGSREQIGRVAEWNGEIEECLHQNHIIKGRPMGIMISKFAVYFLMTKKGRGQIIDVASSTSGLYTLSINKVKSLMLPFCPLMEQAQIVAEIESRLSVCDKLEQLVDENLAKAQALRQSILKKAFAGELVPQDPSDEPAEKLLERIKAMKATATRTTIAGRACK